MLNLTTIFTIMMLPGVCMLATSLIVSFFEKGQSQQGESGQTLIEADAL